MYKKLKNYFCIIGITLWLVGCSSSVELISGLPEQDANEVMLALMHNGISASKSVNKDGNATVNINAGDVSHALDILRQAGLPRTQYQGFGDVFKKDGLISSPLEERARYIYSLSQELENTLSQIDGVLVSRVHVVLPERGSAGDPSLPSSASVFLKYRADYDLDALIPQIRRLVTNSIPGLGSEKVSVVLVPTQATDTLKATSLETVLGFMVDAKSAKSLTWTLGISWMLLALALLFSVLLGWQQRDQLRSVFGNVSQMTKRKGK
jgi:type III secretion protein J